MTSWTIPSHYLKTTYGPDTVIVYQAGTMVAKGDNWIDFSHSHDRYFLNQVADRLVVVADGQAKVIEGDYETYQRLQRQAQEVVQAKRAAVVADKKPDAPSGRVKRKFPYRKAADIERDIEALEAELARLQEILGTPETWRDPDRARQTQQNFDASQARLDELMAHWEEALELN